MTREATSDRLVWIDLEMTGLEVERHRIVELAVLVTDSQLEVVDEGLDLVVHQPPEVLSEMDDFVRKMHTKSGLLRAIESSTLSLEAAGAQALAYVGERVPEPGTAPLCGNSIGVDRRFLNRYLPDLDDYLHYRNIDVSSLKELCRRWFPEVYAKRPSKAETHRALADIKESIAELRYYREHILRPPADLEMRESIVVEAAPSTIWDALTVSRERRAWWPHLELDPTPGGAVLERWDDDGTARVTEGRVVEVVQSRLLRFTWADDDWPAPTEVEIRVDDADRGTLVTVRETGWDRLPEGSRLEDEHRAGWHAHLGNLRRAVEG